MEIHSVKIAYCNTSIKLLLSRVFITTLQTVHALCDMYAF